MQQRSGVRLLPSGDNAVVVEFGNQIDLNINSRVRHLCDRVNSSGLLSIKEAIPTYRSALVYYDPLKISWDSLAAWLLGIAEEATPEDRVSKPTAIIPTAYGGEFGPDMEYVAKHTGLTETEVVRIHSEKHYYVYMMGFTPGYPYMGGMDQRLATPRLPSPRLKTLEGSVGIAGTQTGIYSIESPGGWRIIGRTPVKLFNPRSAQPFLLEAGMLIKFSPVSYAQYHEIAAQVASFAYRPEVLNAESH